MLLPSLFSLCRASGAPPLLLRPLLLTHRQPFANPASSLSSSSSPYFPVIPSIRRILSVVDYLVLKPFIGFLNYVTNVGFDFVMLAIIGLYLIVLFTVLVIATRGFDELLLMIRRLPTRKSKEA
ncbi:uncharacterized protein LOC121984388 [Zingiber officinale]|uniref:uncharacterized protein LOC121984388 n=1 Tax=Zingiber officinale TaxID=94328 RepID=UPI001C4D4F09|nr:uncharacterized protein LOC121984388 [Zingiber officinale]